VGHCVTRALGALAIGRYQWRILPWSPGKAGGASPFGISLPARMTLAYTAIATHAPLALKRPHTRTGLQ